MEKEITPTLNQNKKLLSSTWVELLRLLPGYDPFLQREDCYFDEEAATKAINFFEHDKLGCIRHVKGNEAGKLFKLSLFQKSILANVFGWKRPDGTRRYREIFILIPRKNGKTTFAAGIILFVMFCDGEKGAEIYSAAVDRDQASLVFDQAKGMVLQEPELRKRCEVLKKVITIERMGTSYKAISADAATKHGYNGHCIVVDETHAQKNRELVDVLETSVGARLQPLIIHITTSDYNRPSICNEKYKLACNVRDNDGSKEKPGYDPTFLPVIYEAQPSDDWTDEKVWIKANPNVGVSVSLDYLRGKCRKAQEEPSFENTFKRLHLNVKTEQDERWLKMETWNACTALGPVLEDELKGEECYSGLDLSSVSDITALCHWFPKHNAVLCRFFVPKDTAEERERKYRIPYATWIKMGLLIGTPGNVVDYDFVKAQIKADNKQFKIKELAIDRWNSTHLVNELMADIQMTIVPFGQGYASMSSPTKELDRLIKSKNFKHGGNLVLSWMASNVAIERDSADNIKPCKAKSPEKIDGIVATIMGIGRSMADIQKKSVYGQRGIRTA